MPSVIVAGAGLAGLATAAALGDAGFEVDVFEARPYPGGRAASYTVPSGDGSLDTIDNCQHILLRCCVNLLDFYRRLGVSGEIDFAREFYWVEPGGRTSEFRAGRLPHPAHFTGAFLGLKFLTLADKVALGKAVLAMMRENGRRPDLEQITMLDWLREKKQTPRSIERFWRQVLVSAVNEELDRMAASHGFQVFMTGFLGTSDSFEMGIPRVPLSELYRQEFWRRWPNVRFHFRAPVARIEDRLHLQSGDSVAADYYVSAVPFERLGSILPDYPVPAIEHSPITGVHLWFDRSVTDLPHATLLDSPLQWMFNKGSGRALQIVVSASRELISMSREEVINLCHRDLCSFFPSAASAVLLKARVVKEVRATLSAQPSVNRPGPGTNLPNVFVAGDWTRTGWPSTMEGAVRSGYIAAERVCAASGMRASFLVPELGH